MGETDTPFLYTFASPDARYLGLIIRDRTSFAATAAIMGEIARLDPGLIANIAPLERNIDFWRSTARLIAGLSGSLGGLAPILAATGVYGVVSYSVSRRVREFGIRLVLGANPVRIETMILKQALQPVLLGAAIGLAVALGMAQILQSVLFGVSSYDPIAFFGATLFLICIAAVASLVPARRTVNVDPMKTLRYE